MAEPQSVLTEACRAVAGELATPDIGDNFYFAGGTGLARMFVPVAWGDIKTTIRDEVARLGRRYYGLEGAG